MYLELKYALGIRENQVFSPKNVEFLYYSLFIIVFVVWKLNPGLGTCWMTSVIELRSLLQESQISRWDIDT